MNSKCVSMFILIASSVDAFSAASTASAQSFPTLPKKMSDEAIEIANVLGKCPLDYANLTKDPSFLISDITVQSGQSFRNGVTTETKNYVLETSKIEVSRNQIITKGEKLTVRIQKFFRNGVRTGALSIQCNPQN